MTPSVDITFRNMAASPLLEDEIRARADWLSTYHPHIQHCRVTFEVPHRHQRRGREIAIAIEVGVRDGPVYVHHTHRPNAESPGLAAAVGHRDHPHNQEAVEAIREAFHVARRQLADVARRRRGD